MKNKTEQAVQSFAAEKTNKIAMLMFLLKKYYCKGKDYNRRSRREKAVPRAAAGCARQLEMHLNVEK